MKRNYYLILDTETYGGFQQPIVYDLGMAIIDKKGKVYAKYSFVIDETFYSKEAETAYYADKFPMYHEDIENGKHKVVSWKAAKWIANELYRRYNCKAVVAHNAKFDKTSTDNTTKELNMGNSFFEMEVVWYDTLQMAADTIGKQKAYEMFCKRNDYMTKLGQPRLTAEILYRYITGKEDFIESHTGYEDVLCEKEIFAHCIRQHKKMRTSFFNFSYRH